MKEGTEVKVEKWLNHFYCNQVKGGTEGRLPEIFSVRNWEAYGETTFFFFADLRRLPHPASHSAKV
jgi:hypothetical protein